MLQQAALVTARAVLGRLLHAYPELTHFMTALDFEKKHGCKREYMRTLKMALKEHPTGETLWLTAAKHA